jgi:adenine-specific DNA-methyltransferase
MKIFKNKNAQILHGDIFECLSGLETSSVDLIFADPPYNIRKDFDGLIDFKEESQFLNWCYEWINECHRILKDTGTFYLMNSTQNMPYLDIYCRGKFSIVSRIVWHYDSSGVQAKRYFGSLYEPILMMVKDTKAYTFNHKDIEVTAKTGAERKLIDYRKSPPKPYNTKKVPGNVWDFSRVRYKMDEYENHPTQKPEALLERIILASSKEGDTVLDPFSGSFTTGAVANNLNRRFIGIEINEVYLKMGLRRLSVPSHYNDEDLKKKKARKTKNTSKKDRLQDHNDQK